MSEIVYVGIDVSCKELVTTLQMAGGGLRNKTFQNTISGQQSLIKWVKTFSTTAKVCLEATGIYHLSAALALYDEKFEIMVANPRAISNFGKAMMQRSKTDKLDSEIILNYLIRMPFQKWVPPSKQILELQYIARRIHQLKKEGVREKNRKHVVEYYVEAKFVKNDIEVNLEHINERIENLISEAVKIIKSNDQLLRKFNLLCSIKGISTLSSIFILGEILILPADMQPEHWVAYCGLDPTAKESGSSVKFARHISKKGNHYLRSALYLPALVALTYDDHVKAFYKKLLEKGKKKLQAVVAIMRKLLHCIWGMIKHDCEYDPNKFYKLSVV